MFMNSHERVWKWWCEQAQKQPGKAGVSFVRVVWGWEDRHCLELFFDLSHHCL